MCPLASLKPAVRDEQVPPKAVLPEQGMARAGLAGDRWVSESTACRAGVLRRAPREAPSPDQGLWSSQETLVLSSTFSVLG